jgi:hypothetical protein
MGDVGRPLTLRSGQLGVTLEKAAEGFRAAPGYPHTLEYPLEAAFGIASAVPSSPPQERVWP